MNELVLKKYGDKKVYSFDVFDTVVSRLTLDTTGIFNIMEEFLRSDEYKDLPKYLRTNFARIRHYYEDYAVRRLAAGRQETSSEEIYRYIASAYALLPHQVNNLMELEFATELDCSVAIKETVIDINDLLSLDKIVIFISDMYLPKHVVQDLLRKADEKFAELPLFVSSEYNATKSRGTLFNIVKDIVGIDQNDWVHIGDSEHSDIRVPKSLGLDAKLICYKNKRHFQNFITKRFDDSALVQLILGCSALVRPKNAVYNIGFKYVAPMLTIFVEWILEQCTIRKCKKIYFLARDGYVLKKIADRIIKFRKLPLETVYFYGSRKAWSDGNSAKEKSLVKSYLVQELNGVNIDDIAIVDLFGSGVSINNAMSIWGGEKEFKVKTFYLKASSNEVAYLEKVGFSLDIDVWDNIETFCKAPEGQCLGYRLVNNMIEPMCEQKTTEQIKKFGFDDYILGIDAFLDYYLDADELLQKLEFKMVDVCEWYVKYINQFPDKDLRYFLTEFPRDEAEAKKFKWSAIGKSERRLELKIKKIKYLIRELEKSKIFNLIR